MERSIQQFSSLGLQVQVTELDISVYAVRQGGQIVRNQNRDSISPFTPEMEQLQREKYKMILKFFANTDELSGVTFWNLSDRYTWLDGRGRKNYPLLFDIDRKPKKAFVDVSDF